MDSVSQFLAWIGQHEAVLSGIAAALAIVAVILALSSRTFGLFRKTGGDANSVAPESEAKKFPRRSVTHALPMV